jgi:beta-glucosidase
MKKLLQHGWQHRAIRQTSSSCGNNNTTELFELVRDGQIAESRIDESVKRLLRAKFVLGLFDNPFVNVEQTEKIVGNHEFVEKGKLAQRKSIVLLKNQMNADSSFVLPLRKELKIYVEKIDRKTVSNFATVVDNLADADMAILRINTPFVPRNSDFIERMFHQGDLDFKEPEKSQILKIMNRKPTIVCIYLDRAAVIPEIAGKAAGLLADFGAYDDAVLDVVFGKFNSTAKLPIELPSSMETVKNQKEDLPYDSEKPLVPVWMGIEV